MPEQKKLPEAIHQRISADAEIKYPITGENGGDAEYSFDQIQDRKQMAYVKGATVEATCALKLIYALENIAKGPHNAEIVYQYSLRVQQLAIEVLKEYNQIP